MTPVSTASNFHRQFPTKLIEKNGELYAYASFCCINGTMPTRIADYYNELQRREGLDPVELVAEWAQGDTDTISVAFRNAFAASRITEQTIPIRAGSTNQSIGNQVADFFVLMMNDHLQQYRIDACPGGGYPDKILVEIASGRTFPFELKATSTWDAGFESPCPDFVFAKIAPAIPWRC